MARTVKTSITLSPEAHGIGVRLAMANRMATGSEATLSSIIDGLLIATAKPQKWIEPVYTRRPIGNAGKTTDRIVGWKAFYGDHLIIETDGAGSKPEAQQALDAFVFEELSK